MIKPTTRLLAAAAWHARHDDPTDLVDSMGLAPRKAAGLGAPDARGAWIAASDKAVAGLMNTRASLIAVLLLTIVGLLMGCIRNPVSDATTLKALRSECETLLETTSAGFERVAQSRRPPAIAGLKPASVYGDRPGLYIKLNSWFVAESGYFVPRKGVRVSPTSGTDPSYELLGQGVYWYRIKG